MIPRLYHPHPLAAGDRFVPDREMGRYLTRTLRLRAGAPVVLFNGLDGGEWRGRLMAVGGALALEVLDFRTVPAEADLAVTLVAGLTKGGGLEMVVQKGTELGMAALIPLICQRSVRRLDAKSAANAQRRWRRIAEEAAEQCGRVHVPHIHPPLAWADLGAVLPAGPRLLFWEERERAGRSLSDIQPPRGAVSLLVGPEGGFEAQEVTAARQRLGCGIVTLGPRILRAETAAITAIAACQLLWGDLR